MRTFRHINLKLSIALGPNCTEELKHLLLNFVATTTQWDWLLEGKVLALLTLYLRKFRRNFIKNWILVRGLFVKEIGLSMWCVFLLNYLLICFICIINKYLCGLCCRLSSNLEKKCHSDGSTLQTFPPQISYIRLYLHVLHKNGPGSLVLCSERFLI